MKNYNFSLRAFALAVATLFATTGCSDDSTTEEGGSGNGSTTTGSIQISVSDVEGTSATVTTKPASNSLTYLSDIITKAEFEAHASAQAFAEAELDAIKAEALAEGSSLADYLVATGVLKSGAKNEKVSGLEVSTDYVAYAFGLSSEGEITTEVYTAAFTTAESDPEVTFDITANNITATSAKITVTPSDDTATYYWDLLPSKLVESMSEEELIAALEQLFETNYGVSLYDKCITGADTYTFEDLDPGTEYTIFAFTFTENGEAGKFTTKKIATEDSPIKVAMVAGQYDQTTETFTGTDTYMSLQIAAADKENPVVSCKRTLFETSTLEGYLTEYTYEEIIDIVGREITGTSLDYINETALLITFSEMTPSTSYTAIVSATAQDGKSIVLHIEAATEAATEASEAYSAWLGTWTVTSAKSFDYINDQVIDEPISFDIEIAAQNLNATYEIMGWGITPLRSQAPIVGSFYAGDGSFAIRNDQTLGQLQNGYSVIATAYCSTTMAQHPYTFISGNYDMVTATRSSATEGTATCYYGEGELTGDNSFTVVFFDYFALSGENIYPFAKEGTSGDDAVYVYAMGPYTLTKKSTTTEPDPTPETPDVPETSRLRKSISVPTLSQFSTISRELKMARPAAMKFQATEAACDAKALKSAGFGKQSTDSKKKLAAQLLVK